MLILFDGPEGAGKSSIVPRVVTWLRGQLRVKKNKQFIIPVHEFHEPGSSSIGKTIRELLLHKKDGLSPEAELFLFLAERAEVMRECVRPALDDRAVVVLDRSTISTLAYQLGGRGLPMHLALPACELATKGIVPDLTILLMVDPVLGSERKSKRGDVPDRIESAGSEFHQRVYRGYQWFGQYLAQRAQNPWCIHTIDTAPLTLQGTFDRVIEIVMQEKVVERIFSVQDWGFS